MTPADLADPWWRIAHLYRIVTDDGADVPFVPRPEQRALYEGMRPRNLVLKARQLGFCLDPATRVLTADLRWVAISELQPGQELVGVDEHAPAQRGSARRMRVSTVQGVVRVHHPAFRIHFDDGRSVVCTGRHPWLSRNKRVDPQWRSLEAAPGKRQRLRVGDQVRWVTTPWGEAGVEDGWFGGMLDGEGSLARPSRSGASVNVAQRGGPVWDRLVAYARLQGYTARIEGDPAERPSKHGRVPVPKLVFSRLDEVFRLIGQTRPTRFVGQRFWEGKCLPGKRCDAVGWATITRVEALPAQDLIDLQTTTGTYIAEGFVSHNTTFIDLLMLDQCAFNPNFTGAILAHSLPDAARIFRTKVLQPYQALPAVVRERIPLVKESASELVFGNGSSISVSTSVRSGTVQFLHVSEMGKIARKYPERAREIVTGSFEAVPRDGLIVVESTAEGADGWFHDACMEAQRRQTQGAAEGLMDFHLHFFPWYGKPDYTLPEHVPLTDELARYFAGLRAAGVRLTRGQAAWYAKKAATLREDMKREYPSTVEEAFAQSIEGAIYAREMGMLRSLGRIGRVPVKPGVPVNTFWDLGVNDENTIWLHQRVGSMNRFLRFFRGANEGMRHYWNLIEDWREQHGARWGRHYLPHDGDTRIQGYEAETRRDILLSLGARDVKVVPRIADVRDGIELTRNALPECEFDAEGCAEGIQCLDNYSREWDEDRGAWGSRPRHDKWSHGADSFRQFAQAYRPPAEPTARRVPAGLYQGGY